MKTRQKIKKGIILFTFFLFPAIFYYLSPVLIIQATARGIINGSFVMFLLMFISALFLGRAEEWKEKPYGKQISKERNY